MVCKKKRLKERVQMTINMLNLPNLKVKDMKEFEDDYRFLV